MFSPDGRTLISAGRDRTVRFWERGTGREVRRFTVAAKGQVYSLALAANGKILATGSESHVSLWETDSGKELHRMSVLPALSRPVALSPDGSILASGSSDRAVYLWKVATGEVIGKLTGHGGTITAVAFSQDGKTLASASEDRLVCLWDMPAGNKLQTFRHAAVVSQILFTPDSKKLIAAGDDDLRVWTTAGTELRNFQTRGEIALSRDGAVLAVAGTFLALFDLATGEEIRRHGGAERSGSVVAADGPDSSAVRGCPKKGGKRLTKPLASSRPTLPAH